MAQNLLVTPGTGATVAAEEIGGVKYSLAKLMDGSSGATLPIGTAVNPWSQNLSQVGGTSYVLGQANATLSLPVVLPASQITTLTPIAPLATVTALQGGSPWNVIATIATLPVVASGTVTANAGTNLNTSLLALESGGNLASLVAKDYATQTTLALIKAKTDNIDVSLSTRLASGSTLPITGAIDQGNAGTSAWLVTLATLSVVGSFSGGSALATVTSIQGDAGTKPWLATLATLPVMANIVNTPSVSQNGTWTVLPGNTPNTTAWLVTMATLSVVTQAGGSALATITAIQGDPGTKAWLTTMSTLSAVVSGTVTANAGTNLNTSLLALESGGNLASLVAKDFATQTTLALIKAKTDNIDVALSTRQASGATLPITGTVTALAAGGTLTAYQGGTWTVQPGNTPNTTAWLATLATLPVFASQAGTWALTANAGTNLNTSLLALDSTVAKDSSLTTLNTSVNTLLKPASTLAAVTNLAQMAGVAISLNTGVRDTGTQRVTIATNDIVPASQSGTWTVQPGNTPNTVPWLATLATLPVMANIVNTPSVSQNGTWTVQPGNTPNTTAWLATLATLPVFASQAGTWSMLNAGGTVTSYQGGIWGISSLPTLTINAFGNLASLTAAQHAQGSGYTTGDGGISMWMIRNDSLASLTSANLGYTPSSGDTYGRNYVVQKAFNAMSTLVSGATTSTTLLAAHNDRTSGSIYNNSTNILYVYFGTGATFTKYKTQLAASTYWEVPGGYTGIITGFWATSLNGSAAISEET